MCATVMHPQPGTDLWWGSLADGRFIFVDPQAFNDAPLRYSWSPQWWLNRLKRDQDLEQFVWVEAENGREVVFT